MSTTVFTTMSTKAVPTIPSPTKIFTLYKGEYWNGCKLLEDSKFCIIPVGLEFLCSPLFNQVPREFDHVKNSDHIIQTSAENNTNVVLNKASELAACKAEIAKLEDDQAKVKKTEKTADDNDAENKKMLTKLKLKLMRLEYEYDLAQQRVTQQRKFVGYNDEDLLTAYMSNCMLDNIGYNDD